MGAKLQHIYLYAGNVYAEVMKLYHYFAGMDYGVEDLTSEDVGYSMGDIVYYILVATQTQEQS